MKWPFLFFLLFESIVVNSQVFENKDGTEFNSIFQNLKDGSFSGKCNGKLTILNLSSDTMSIIFDNEAATLNIVPDLNEIYDISRKKYFCKGKDAGVEYSVYAHSNAFFLEINGLTYGFTAIDGDCYHVIKNIDWCYSENEKGEELSLDFIGNVDLACPANHINSKFITVLSGSKIRFMIERSSK